MNIITVVRYKLKSGFEDEFIKAINAYNYSNSILMRLVSIGNDEYLSIMEYDEIDKTGDDEISGVEWLDSIDHMLEFFGESSIVSRSAVRGATVRALPGVAVTTLSLSRSAFQDLMEKGVFGENKDEIMALLQRRSVKWRNSDRLRSNSASSNGSNPGSPSMMDPRMRKTL